MSLIDTTGMSDPKVPSLNLPAKVTVKVDDLVQGIKASETVSDHIALTVSPEEFEMTCEGDLDQVNWKKAKKDLEELESPSSVRSGTCIGKIPISPSEPGRVTISTSFEYT